MRRIIIPLTIVFCAIFLFTGIVFVSLGAIFGFIEKDFKENGVPIKAEITNIVLERNYDGEIEREVYVSFDYSGVTYSDVYLGYSSSSMFEGQELEIYFTPADGDILYVEGNRVFIIVFSILGGFFCIFGIAILITGIIIKKVTRPVQEYGIKYIGQAQQVEFVSGNYMNQTYMVHCTYSDNAGITQYVRSSPVMINPSWPLPLGSPVDIYVDPKNPTKYYVDVNTALNRLYNQGYMHY